MKRKIKIILIAVIAFYSTGISAQTDKSFKTDGMKTQSTEYVNYYSSDKVSGPGFTFIIDRDPDGRSSYYTIWNIHNVKFFMPPFTTPPEPPALAPGEEEPIYNYNYSSFARFSDINQFISSVRDGLGTDIINEFKLLNNDGRISIRFIVELNGTVSEVKFLIDSDNQLLLSIPPEKLYAIECLIKQRVTFIIQQRPWLPNFFERNISIKIKDL
jgi:hypothetical protein